MKGEAPVQLRVPVAANTNGAARAADWPKPERRSTLRVDRPYPDPGSDRHRLFGLRAQGAALFVLLVIVVVGLLANISVAYRASDDTSREQTALLTWRHDAAQVDSYGSTLASGLYQWNNLLTAGDAPGAQAQMTAAQSQIAAIQSLLTEISNLSLPADAMGIKSTFSDASLAFTRFASKFLAAGVHPDADLQIEVGGANAIRAAARTPVGPFIDQEVADNQSIENSRRAYVYQLIDFGGIVALVLLLILAFIVFRLILTPVVRLADAATTLAAGRPAMIRRSARKDEIGQLTRALAAWQENSVAGLNDVSSRAGSAAIALSTVAEQLASATLEQTSAASATSASMDELARSSGSIADTIDGVAVQAAEVSSNLKQAQTDLRASGDRTLALAGRINEIESILTVLNDIADQTNLLALNAAIEAARAGDAGRGFAVVADEVRRLAERSKAAAAQIAKLVEGVQGQSSETVMALEKGVKQMERGLGMMLAMAEVSGQVRLATQQQRSSTEVVVRAIEHIAESSRSVAATSQEIASAAAKQSDLAGELENMSSNTAAESSHRSTPPVRLGTGKQLGEVVRTAARVRGTREAPNASSHA